MKAKVLTGSYSYNEGFTLYRVYLEADFEQAQADLDLIIRSNPDKTFRLDEVELYSPNNHKIL